jgi:hypothetical protein
MRWFVMLLALAGAGGTGFLGFHWYQLLSDPSQKQIDKKNREGAALLKTAKIPIPAELQREIDKTTRRYNSLPFIAAGALFAVFGAILALARYKWSAFLLLATAPVGPIVFDPMSAIFVGILGVAALFALLIRQPKPALAGAGEGEGAGADEE